jgi:molybdate transport system substrate-binding protein
MKPDKETHSIVSLLVQIYGLLLRVRAFLYFITFHTLIILPGFDIAEGHEKILVFAAGSTINAITEVGGLFNKQDNETCIISCAASSTLAKQIAQGAPADIFISANPKWMDYLSEKNLIESETRFDLLGNRLVLIAPISHDRLIEIKHGLDFTDFLGKERLAMGDPDHVPAGIYGKQALITLGMWDDIKNRVAPMKDVRAALVMVERGETPFGIVYSTDARISKKIRIVDTFPETSHDPITYPVAIVAGKKSLGTNKLISFLQSPKARDVFLKYGFVVK